MNWRVKIFLFYILVGLAGVAYIEFENLFILESSWKKILKYNLPFVLLQCLVFVIVYYIYTVKKLGIVFQADEAKLLQLTHSERKVWFDQLVLFPYKMFRFSIIFTICLAISFHLYEILFIENVSKGYFLSLFFILLREISIAMIITLLIVAVLGKLVRPYVLKLKILTFNNVQLSLSKKIYFIFFSILFIIVTDISWLLLNMDGAIESQMIKILVTLCLLSVFAIIVIRLTVLDSINHIQTVAQSITKAENGDRTILQESYIPITSSDEIAFLIGNFNKLQFKIQSLYTELEDELRLAYTVQQNLLPKESLSIGEYTVEGVTLPVKEVGGDFFDLIKINEQKMVILIGDVSGKGVPAALLMSVAIGVIRGKTQSDEVSPAQLLNECNQLLVPMLSEGMYVTMGIGIIDVGAFTFTYASAGHVPPLVKNREKLDYFEISALPIGLDENERYEERMIPLTDLDGIIFYTDGIIEQVDTNQEMFGFKRFYQLIANNWDIDMQSIIVDVNKFHINSKRLDDMTIVCFKKMGPKLNRRISNEKIKILDIKIESVLGEEKRVLKQLGKQLSNYSFIKEDCEEFKVALAEICINAIEHGNQEERQKQVHVVVTLMDDLIQSTVVMDQGTGFNYEEKERDTRGWGLKIVQQFVDHWTMYQQLGPKPQFCVQIEKRLRTIDQFQDKDE